MSARLKGHKKINISVIIPTYNRAANIKAAIESVLNQSCLPYEVIVVDDGSIDHTADIVYSIDSPILKYFYQRNAGGAAARNTGIRKAIGEWIAFLDSDDTWKPEKLRRQVELIFSDEELDFIHTNRTYCALDGKENSGRVGVGVRELTDKDYLLRNWAIKLSTVMVKRSLLDTIGGRFNEKLRLCHDYELLWKAVIASQKIGYIEETLVKILKTDDGLSRAYPYVKSVYAHFAARESVMSWLGKRKQEDDLYKSLLRKVQGQELKQLFKRRYHERSMIGAFNDIVYFSKTASKKITVESIISIAKSINLKKFSIQNIHDRSM